MDLESITLILTLILSILALLISVLGFLDNRKKTKILKEQNEDNRKKTEIMEKQLNLVQEQTQILQRQSESRQDIQKTLKIVNEIQEGIPKLGVEKYDWGDFGKFAPIRFLEMLHDSGETSISWEVYLGALFGKTVGKGTEMLRLDVNNFEAFERLFSDMVPKPETEFVIGYISTPKIMLNTDVEIDTIQVRDYVTEIYSLAIVYEKLKSVEKIVNMYDSSILLDIQKLYTRILNSLYENFAQDQEIKIESKIKTKDMKNHLLKFVSLDIWQECIKELKQNVSPRLIEITRHLRESA